MNLIQVTFLQWSAEVGPESKSLYSREIGLYYHQSQLRSIFLLTNHNIGLPYIDLIYMWQAFC